MQKHLMSDWELCFSILINNTKYIILLLILLSTVFVYAQSDVDYRPAKLVKTLKKEGVTDTLLIEEINLPQHLVDSITLNGKFFKINEKNNSLIKFVYVGRVYSCRSNGCSLGNPISENVSSEYFDYFILFDHDKTVHKVVVYNYQATHGHEVSSRGWLRQFVGYTAGGSLSVGKNVDAISGATISVYAITDDIKHICSLLQRL